MGQPVELFDGHSLNGWVKANGQPVDSGWAVENGTLTRASGGGDIFTQTEFENFTLSFEWKIATGGNSGVKYRVRKYGNAWLGCEYQVLDDKDQPYNKHSSGSLYDVFAPSQNKVPVSPGTWNAALIVVNGNRITHWLNGQKLIDVDTDSDQWLQAINSSKFRGREGFGTNARGKIMLQDHGHQVWFKNIVLTPIESVETVKPSVISNQTANQSVVVVKPTITFFQLTFMNRAVVPGTWTGAAVRDAGSVNR